MALSRSVLFSLCMVLSCCCLCCFFLQVRVSKPDDPEFRGMNGGLGVYGVLTEFLMQMTPLSYTTLVTVEQSDKNMLQDVQNLLKTVRGVLVNRVAMRRRVCLQQQQHSTGQQLTVPLTHPLEARHSQAACSSSNDAAGCHMPNTQDMNSSGDRVVLLQVAPHILVFWRPDINRYRAFVVGPAKKGKHAAGLSPLCERTSSAALLQRASVG